MGRRKGNKVIALEKVKDTHAQEFRDNANVIAIIKTILQVNAFPARVRS